MQRIYLDHSATTPIRKEVFEAMVPYLTEHFGNPSSIHASGREAKKAVEEAREKIALLVNAKPEEIIFTSGGTEADNYALIGIAMANQKKGNHIITSAIEHHAIIDTCKYLETQGFEVTYLPVYEDGIVHVEDFKNAITDKTILITIMHVNNEIGTIQPLAEIGTIAKAKGIFFHTDAVQSVGKIPVDVNDLNVNLLSMSSHKIYGPKGIGCLYIKRGTRINNIAFGGGQERKRRPGTENVPAIVGFGKAAEIALAELETEAARLTILRDKLIDGVMKTIPNTLLNGHPTKRLPGNANFSFRFIEGESLLLMLDMKGIAGSSGSACTSGSLDPSHVLLALGMTHEVAHGSLRLTLGKQNTEEEIDIVLDTLPGIVERLRSMSPLNESYISNSSCEGKEYCHHV